MYFCATNHIFGHDMSGFMTAGAEQFVVKRTESCYQVKRLETFTFRPHTVQHFRPDRAES